MIYRLLVFALATLALAATSCERRPQHRDRTAPDSESTAGTVPGASITLPHSVTVTGASAAAAIVGRNHVEATSQAEGLLLRATGNDPYVVFRVAPERLQTCAVRLDLTAPADTQLELFYEVNHGPFTADHVLSCPLPKGRSEVLLHLSDPRFTGGLRIDPGMAAGEYMLHAVGVFARQAVRFVLPPRSQEELALAFNASQHVTWSSSLPEALDNVRAAGDAQVKISGGSLQVTATGADPRLILPPLDATSHAIIKVTLTPPTATVVQAFYKSGNAADFLEADSASQEIAPAESTIYLELKSGQPFTDLRFDPGAVAGVYTISDIEVRTPAEAGH